MDEPGRAWALLTSRSVMADAFKSLNNWITFAGCVLVIGALYWAQAVLVPVCLAILLTFILTPPVTWLQRRVGRLPAILTVVILVFSFLGLAGYGVYRQMASMILADDNFATIIAAVEEGRSIFSNIRKFLRYLLSSNIGEVLTMFFGVLLANKIGLRAGGDTLVLPLLATQLLWINLVTDGAPALALGVDPADEGLMLEPPRPPTERVITAPMWRGIFFIGAVMAAGTLFVLDASLPGGLIDGAGDMTYAQTMAFTTLMLGQLFNVFNARSERRSAFRGVFMNPWLWAAIGLSVVMHIAVIYVPSLQRAFSTRSLSGLDWLECTVVASAVLWAGEARKAVSWLRRRSA